MEWLKDTVGTRANENQCILEITSILAISKRGNGGVQMRLKSRLRVYCGFFPGSRKAFCPVFVHISLS